MKLDSLNKLEITHNEVTPGTKYIGDRLTVGKKDFLNTDWSVERSNTNEDAAFVNPACGFAIVADGISSYQGGRLAAGIAVASVIEKLQRDKPESLEVELKVPRINTTFPKKPQSRRELEIENEVNEAINSAIIMPMEAAFKFASDEVRRVSDERGLTSNGAAAAAAQIIEVVDGQGNKARYVAGVNAGDVRVGVFNRLTGTFRYISLDQTFLTNIVIAQTKLQNKNYTEEDLRLIAKGVQDNMDNLYDVDAKVPFSDFYFSPHNNSIMNSLGRKNQAPNSFIERMHEGDEVIIMSDGPSDMLTRDEIATTAHKATVNNRARSIAGMAVRMRDDGSESARFKIDDITVVSLAPLE